MSVWAGLRQTPWKGWNEGRRLLLRPFAHLVLRWHGVSVGSRSKIFGLPLIQRHAGSTITLGDDVHLRSWFASSPLGLRRCVLATWQRDAELTLGDGAGLSGAVICAATRIAIGRRVQIGAHTTIVDTDFHPLDAELRRHRPRDGDMLPVVVEDDVWIGMSVLVLKGSRIGAGAVIGAGSVVTGAIPERALAAGNPARVLRTL